MLDADPTWEVDDELRQGTACIAPQGCCSAGERRETQAAPAETASMVRPGQVTLNVYLSLAVFHWSDTNYTANHRQCLQSHRLRASPNHCLQG